MFSPPVALPHSFGGPRFPTYPETLILFFPPELAQVNTPVSDFQKTDTPASRDS